LGSRKSALGWLLAKEWRELLASRAWWVMLVLMGPLVGVAFTSAVGTYAELSGYGGTAEGVGEAFSPLVGIWAPTFSACEVAAAFLLPFVAIRVVAGDRQSGALKLELQQPLSVTWRVLTKSLVLMAGWLVASIPTAVAVLLWLGYGGSLHAPELAVVALGHVLNAGLTVALASAAAAITDHPSTAAIVTLSVTVGTWILQIVAAVKGGLWEWLAAYTPTAMVAGFQHGLIRLDVVAAAGLLAAGGTAVAAIWTRLGVPARRKSLESLAAAAVTALGLAVCPQLTASWDLSENRMNSFARGDEAMLRELQEPLHIVVHLAAEDPRRVDLERRALAKLSRVLPRLDVRYVAATSTGLFEQTREHYGEIWYELGGRRTIRRATTPESVLEAIYELAGRTPPGESAGDVFRGHPLAVPATGAAAVFYGLWPAAALATGAWVHRRQT